jgi:hypothetical protein
MNLSLSFSKYSTFEKCPLKYIFQYVIKPAIPDEDDTYPLILGKLTHLFIELYHEHNMDVESIRKLSENLDKLHDYINLVYLAYNYNSKKFASQSIDLTAKTESNINFINENKVVFFHAFKLFKGYLEKVHSSFQNANIECEFTFNNVYKLGDHNLCMYGSIDLIFWLITNRLKYIYFSDFKTGKSIDEYAILQLYFYFYNLLNYDYNVEIVNNPDKLDKVKTIQEILQQDDFKTYGIVFKLREPDQYKKIELGASENDLEYHTFIDRMFDTVENVIIPIHMNKNTIEMEEYVDKYSDKINYVTNDSCGDSDMSFHCKYCKFVELCKYRIKR